MVHNRTMGFPCNFGWWRQQQTAFFQVQTSNFPLRKFQVSSHNRGVRLSISPMIDQMNFSREFNTLYMASSPRANSELCLSFFGYSLCINLLSCASISAQTWIFISCSQTSKLDRSTDQLEHLESFCSASKAQDSSLVYNSRLSFVLS